MDAAIDEEEKIVEDLLDDQDEEGNDIKHNNGNMDEDQGQDGKKDFQRNGNNMVGALEVPHPFLPQEDTHQDMNMGEDLGNQGNYYENNLDNNIRNLRRPEFH